MKSIRKRRASVSGESGFLGHGEVALRMDQLRKLREIFDSHPTIVAAKSVLQSQLLGGGLQLKVNGEVVPISSELSQHIEEFWMPFARSFINSVLVGGFAVIAYEKEHATCAMVRAQSRHRCEGVLTGSIRGHKARMESKSKTVDNTKHKASSVVPVVVPLDLIDVSFVVPDMSYQRKYIIRRTKGINVVDEDTDAVLIIHEPPDEFGNINSPMASVQSIIAFIETLTDSAMVAELNRSDPLLVTEQQRAHGGGVQATDMYFDAESQEISKTQSVADNETQAKMLKTQLDLCRAMNVDPNISSSQQSAGRVGGASSAENSQRRMQMVSRMFALPRDQTVASAVPVAQSRTDLPTLVRLSMEMICAAMGVPSTLLFEGRYSSNMPLQIGILNSTVQRLGKLLNTALTQSYVAIHGNHDVNQRIELSTVIEPMSSIDSIVNLYQSGLADFDVAAPLALSSIGLSATDISMAIKRHHDTSGSSNELPRPQTLGPSSSTDI